MVDRQRLAEAEEWLASATVRRAHEIHVHPVAGDQLDLWMRDIAPTFTIRRDIESGRHVLDGVVFNFNGWGGRFTSETCSSLARTYLGNVGIQPVLSSITSEGGALEVDGEGTLMASESSLINDNRNPGLSKDQIEAELSRVLGVTKFIWIPGLKNGDATDFHIDAYARFARPGVVLVSTPSETEKASAWTEAYAGAREILSSATDAQGRKLEIIEIQEPRLENLVTEEDDLGQYGYRPVHSYVNLLIVNGGVIFPQFGDEKMDRLSEETAKKVFGEEREVVPVLIRELPLIGGGIHCSSQEVPLTEACG
jgi:agmatine deiminase